MNLLHTLQPYLPLQALGGSALQRRMQRIHTWRRDPLGTQARLLHHLVRHAQHTAFGKQHGFADIRNAAQFRARVPVQAYEPFFPWIERMLQGEANVLWPGKVGWFSKSSGTTNAASKFIPMPPESLHGNHYAIGKDMLALYLDSRPDSRIFQGLSLSMGGSHEISQGSAEVRYGDLSAVLIQNMPAAYELFRTPSKAIALMDEWETKIEAIAQHTLRQDVRLMAGVPTWTVVLLRRLLELTGRPHIGGEGNPYPHLEVFFHGAVAFTPYRQVFAELVQTSNMAYRETYNASEGFFALQDDPADTAMLLMLDYGIWYEFVPLEEVGNPHPVALSLDQVEIGKNYALVITTNGGLWRYLIGDTVRFTSKDPYKLLITGRTKHFINAFGEELVVENADAGITEACAATSATVTDYTAAPIYFQGSETGGHEWIIEYGTPPRDQALFERTLDETMQRLNTDYRAKRYKDMALRPPLIHVAPQGTFYDWMRRRGKLGGQHKVPRLANSREHLDNLLALMQGRAT